MSGGTLIAIVGGVAAIFGVVGGIIAAYRANQSVQKARDAAKRSRELAAASEAVREAVLSYEEALRESVKQAPETGPTELNEATLRALTPDEVDAALAAQILQRDPEARLVKPETFRRAVQLFRAALPPGGDH